MIKIALVCHSAGFMGAEKMLFGLAGFLKASEKYHPVVFLPKNPIIHDFIDMCGDEIETYPITQSKYYLYINNSNANLYAEDTLQRTEELAKAFVEQNISIVVCNTMTSLAPALAARKVGIPVLLWCHGVLDAYYISSEYDLERRLIYDRLLMALSDQVVCCSKWTENYYAPISLALIKTINNWSADVEKIVPIPDNHLFICLNTFDPHKGVLVLLKAAALLKKKRRDFQIKLFGTGSEEEKLKEFVKKNDLSDIVSFCGRTNNVTAAYQQSFCLIQPCDLEPFGLTMTEAMSNARPTIAVKNGGPCTIVDDGVTGFLVPPRDEKALAEKMERLLDEPELAKEMGLRGRERYERMFSPERAKKEFFELFERISQQPIPRDGRDTLISDMILNFLRLESEASFSSILGGGRHPQYREEDLCFSGALSGKRSYAVSCDEGRVSQLSLLFACHSEEPLSGTLRVRLLQSGKQLNQGSIKMKEIKSDVWTSIKLDKEAYFESGTAVIELTFDYDKGSGRLGVYESRSHRGFIYKVCNKLKHPIMGIDALVVHLQG